MSLNKVLNKILKENYPAGEFGGQMTREAMKDLAAQQAYAASHPDNYVDPTPEMYAKAYAQTHHDPMERADEAEVARRFYGDKGADPSWYDTKRAELGSFVHKTGNEINDAIASRVMDAKNAINDGTATYGQKAIGFAADHPGLVGGGLLASALGAGAGVMALRKKLRSVKK